MGDEAGGGHGAGQDSVEAKYEPRIDKARQDPGLQQRIRDEMARELKAVKASYTKFEGQKSGWDVSIVGPEFQQNTSEAVIVTKEDIWTRYFFFFEDGLYKMFLGFNKDAIGGKNFAEFGKGMESKYGNAREVYRDDKTRGGVTHKLDHYEWSAGGGDRLKLIDRPSSTASIASCCTTDRSRIASSSGARSSTPASSAKTSWLSR